MEKEIWKDIPGYEGYYQASTLGRIRSLDRDVFNRGAKRHLKRKIRVASPDSDGYLGLLLSKGGVNKSFRVNRLIALTFIPNPESKTEVNHKDLNKRNNRVENLEWCSRKENERHSRANSVKNVIANKRCKPVSCKETGQAFRSISAASRALNIPISSIDRSLKEGIKVNGFSFSVISKEEFNSLISKQGSLIA